MHTKPAQAAPWCRAGRQTASLGWVTELLAAAAGMAKMSEKQLWGAEKGMKAWEIMVQAMSEEERSGAVLTCCWQPCLGAQPVEL